MQDNLEFLTLCHMVNSNCRKAKETKKNPVTRKTARPKGIKSPLSRMILIGILTVLVGLSVFLTVRFTSPKEPVYSTSEPVTIVTHTIRQDSGVIK